MSAVVIVDRRRAYYERAAEHIAADPLDFYTRAERGRRWIAQQFAIPIIALTPAPAAPATSNVLILPRKVA